MKEAAEQWGNTSFLIYVQIADDKNFASVTNVIKNAIHDHVSEKTESLMCSRSLTL
jgi:hypothetical protein